MSIDALPRLGIVSRIGAGFDTVDTAACEAHGVWVANSPDYGVGRGRDARAGARARIGAQRGSLPPTTCAPASGTTCRRARCTRPAELTLGIVGLGRIGKRMAHVSRNVFKRVVAYDPYLIDGDFPAYVERARSLEDLAAQSDIVSLHTPLNATTRGMIGARFFAAAKPG